MAGIAYNDNFTIESFYNGTKFTHMMSLAEGILDLGSSPTTEPNGLRLSVPVKPNDVQTFREKAQHLYTFFEHKPNLNLDLDLTSQDKYLNSSDTWFVSRYGNGYGSRNRILMSNVLYNIPDSNKLTRIGVSNLVIKVPTGQVAINPGREHINLTDSTIQYLNTQLRQTEQEFVANINADLLSIPVPLDVLKKYVEVDKASNFSIMKQIDLNSALPTTLRGLVSDCYVYPNYSFYANYGNAFYLSIKPSHAQVASKLSYGVHTAHATSATYLIIDLKTRFSEAIKAQSSAMVLKRNDGITMDHFVAQAIKFCSDLGVPYLLASDIVDKVESTAPQSRAGIYICPSRSTTFASSVKAAATQEYWYVPTINTTATLPTGMEYHHLRKAFNQLCTETGKDIKLVGIQKKYTKLAENDDSFHEAIPALLAYYQGKSYQTPSYSLRNQYSLPSLLDLSTLPSNTPAEVVETLALTHTYRENRDNYVLDTELLEALPMFNATVNIVNYKVEPADLYTKYPMLEHTLHAMRRYDLPQSTLNHYLNLEGRYALHSDQHTNDHSKPRFGSTDPNSE